MTAPPVPALPRASGAPPPGPRARFPGQFLLAMGRDPLGFLADLQRAHGDVARFRMAGREFVLLSHPDDVREVLVTDQRRYGRGYRYRTLKLLLGEGLLTSEGDFHLRQRRLAQPAFHRERVAGYARAMGAAAERWDARWRARARDATPVDVADEMAKLALAIVSETLFGADVTREADAVARALDVALHSATPAFAALGRWAVHLPIPAARRFRHARADLDAVIYRLIAERRRSGADQGDLLSMLLLATEPGDDGGGTVRMTDRQLRDEAMTLFLAGHETTANLLAWSWYLLALYPEVAERLRDSLTATLEGRTPTIDDLPRLGYARQVLSEALRLYPPAWALGRVALAPASFGGYAVPAGAGVLLSPYLVQRDPRWWPEPTHFDPDRWAPGAGTDRHRFAYVPFGAGTRICIGEQFAWTEALIVLATLAPRWAPALAPGARVEPEPIITLRPRHGIPMTLHAR